MQVVKFPLAFILMSTLISAAEPPVAKVVPKKIEVNGDTRIDNYFWLRDDARKDPEVLKYLEAENAYTESVLKGTEGLQKKLYDELIGRIKQTDENVPVRRGEYFYYMRTVEGKQYPINCRKKGSLSAPEEILVDQNALAAGQKYFRIGAYQPSPNQELLAYTVDTEGDEVYTLVVKDLKTGKMLTDQVRGVYYSLAWANDNKTLFYNVLDSAKRPYKIFRHTLGTDAKADVEVFHEKDERFEAEVAKTKSGEYLFIDSNSKITSEVLYLKADQPQGPFQVLLPRKEGIEYGAVHHGKDFFVQINDTGRNFRVVRIPVKEPSMEHAVEVIPHSAENYITRIDAYENHLVVVQRQNGLAGLRVEDLRTGKSHTVATPEPVYAITLGSPDDNPEFHTNQVRFTYTSLVTPKSVYDYDMDKRALDLKKRDEVLGGYDPNLYATERIFATAQDGKKVPIALVYKKGLKKDGSNPTFLYAYGSYGINTEPVFSPDRLSLLDRGFVYAIASIRGGSEMGKPWHDDGRMLTKRNTFTDFIAAAQYLIEQKYTRPDKLGIMGGSAGGLLMGAVVNMRPDLFGAVIAKVPFVDVINTMLDESLPLTVGEFEEWGNPKESKYYGYMRSYSPYDNVERQTYPNMLVTAGLNDPRVSYWEPAKWVAKLRTMKKGDNLLLLKTNMGAGHFGASGRYDRYKEIALDYAFLLVALGVEKL